MKLFAVVITVLVLSISEETRTESNVGCLFSKRVCRKSEWCFDDFAFGRCVSRNKESASGDFYRYELSKDALILLEKEMRMLFVAGYRWTHGYTQCVVKNILYSFRFRTDYKRESCGHKEDEDLERALEMLEAGEAVDPKDLAIIKFTPSAGDANAEFGDEIYFPPLEKNADTDDDGSYVGVVKKYPSPVQEQYVPLAEQRKMKQVKTAHHNNKILAKRKRYDATDYDLIDYMNFVPHQNVMSDEEKVFSGEDEAEDEWSFSKRKQQSARKLHRLDPIIFLDNVFNDNNAEDEFANVDRRMDSDLAFTRPYRYDVKKPGPFFNVNNYFFQKEKEQISDDNRDGDLKIFRHHPLFEDDSLSYDSPSARYDQQKIQIDSDKGRKTKVNATLPAEHNSAANIDATTPGEYPLYLQHPSSAAKSGTETMALNRRKWRNKAAMPMMPWIAESMQGSAQSPIISDYQDESRQKFGYDKFGDVTNNEKTQVFQPANLLSPGLPNRQDTKLVSSGSTDDPDQYDVVDTSYAFLTVDKDLSPEEGLNFVLTLEKLLKLPRGTFSSIRTERNQVTFKVENNDNGWNASTIASKAEHFKSPLKESTGRSLTTTGIGDQTKISVVTLESDNRLFVITFVVCGSIAGILIAVGVLYVVRRHARSRQKLQTLTQPDTEASHDYQDLCRQRMASKTNEKQEPMHAVQRVSSLSRESKTSTESPSSRSSTSSWNEEPVVSNMDISTGHMVLSYMEDHLTNKDRLEQEWVALCAYEADPASTNCALKAVNVRQNRYEDVLPYDHSRIVLNDETNIGSSDYINASTITDHDPRNPAYIATQGPLPHTSADFWQMIWEQGSVVIVMLTRLVENGMAMCHRYWPEEGSELYYIYEVHLVSEHIWCEDYLVRSLYLKNLKTGETRTVTQFHFMSWPDNGVPSSIKALLEFRRKVNKSYRGRSCPIAVHCSDGVGRTGTYCLIDMVLNRMAKGTKEIDIAATLEHIRDQRAGMVKTKAQFEFALMAVAEEVHAILKALPQ